MAKYNQLTVGVVTPTAMSVSKLPPASAYKGSIIYVSDTTTGAVPNTPVLAFSNGTSWLRLTVGVDVTTAT